MCASWACRSYTDCGRLRACWARAIVTASARHPTRIPHYFLDMGGDSLLAFFEYPKGIAKVDRDAIGAMQHVSFACGPRRYHQILERLKANEVTINAGPLMVIPRFIPSIFLILMASGSKSPLTSTARRRICKSSDLAA